MPFTSWHETFSNFSTLPVLQSEPHVFPLNALLGHGANDYITVVLKTMVPFTGWYQTSGDFSRQGCLVNKSGQVPIQFTWVHDLDLHNNVSCQLLSTCKWQLSLVEVCFILFNQWESGHSHLGYSYKPLHRTISTQFFRRHLIYIYKLHLQNYNGEAWIIDGLRRHPYQVH